jgi:hypothetical protein
MKITTNSAKQPVSIFKGMTPKQIKKTRMDLGVDDIAQKVNTKKLITKASTKLQTNKTSVERRR